MNLSTESLESLLARVERPARYTGREVNAVVKDLGAVDLVWALAFPDVYEIGMDNLGVQILYHVLNARPWIACERVFAPWVDMESLLRSRGIPLFTLENRLPVREVDILGFTLPYEIVSTNVLAMLDLAGLPLRSLERDEGHPLVAGGGAMAFNPEPLADFFDFFVLGDGEEVVLEISEVVRGGKERGDSREAVLEALSEVEGVYVPALFRPRHDRRGTLVATEPVHETVRRPRRRVVSDLDAAPFPVAPVVANMPTVHDRLTFEIARGCTAGCRFCQAGCISRPTRERAPATVLEQIQCSLNHTGFDAISLSSLSPGDYSCINTLLTAVNARYADAMISTSVSSLQVKTLTPELTRAVVAVKRSNFTVAPEAGTQRLRDAINKNLSDADLLETTATVFRNGGQGLKMYFMIGLPGETDEDILGIADLALRALEVARKYHRRPTVTVSVSTFVPKPFTPYQWAAQISPEETRRRQGLLRGALPRRSGIRIRLHDSDTTLLEGVLGRGGRGVGRVLEEAFRLGCRFDGWKEHLDMARWQLAFERAGVRPEELLRERSLSECLPWDHLDGGVSRKFLEEEWRRHQRGLRVADCRWGDCGHCGACRREVRVTTFDGQDPLASHAVTPGEGRQYHHPQAAFPALPSPSSERPAARQARLPWQRIRFRYTKTGLARFIGHLELVRIFLLALRRVGVRLRYSQGFHPAPRIVFSNPLPVGVESLAEYVDIDLVREHGPIDPEALRTRLNDGQLPEGLFLTAVESPGFPINGMSSVIYEIRLPETVAQETLEAAVARFETSGPWTLRRKKRTIDVHALVMALGVQGRVLRLELATPRSGTMKPSEFISLLLPAVDLAEVRILKCGCRFEPRNR